MSSSGSSPPDDTHVDLGEDLLKTATLESTVSGAIHGDSAADQLESARILANEGLFDEAKRILRGVLIKDPSMRLARVRLAEIQEVEMKRLLSGSYEEARKPLAGRASNVTTEELEAIDADELMRGLDRDLELGEFPARPHEGWNAEVAAFGDRASAERVGIEIEKDLVGIPARDRLDLGVGFLEMGFYDLAIRQFQSASRDEEHQKAALALTAEAYLASDRPFEASLVTEQVLTEPILEPETRVHFLYLLGVCFERMGNIPASRTKFREVYEIDPAYRDVIERV